MVGGRKGAQLPGEHGGPLERVAPRLDLEFSQLLDPKAPPKAATLADITTLVVSHETVVGARKVSSHSAS